jgi:5'-nucleotidase
MSLDQRVRRALSLVAASLLVSALVAPSAQAAGRHSHPSKSISVRVIGLNDFHGNLEPPGGSSGRVILDNGSTVDAGGAVYLAAHVKQLKEAADHAFVVSSGDNIGASPLLSAAFHDEPTIDLLNDIGVKASAVGNHEFDEGLDELKRIESGGCHADGCQFDSRFRGADFPYLGANVTYARNGRHALQPFTVRVINGVPIGIIGVTLQDLPSVVVPSGITGLAFGEEVAAINATSKVLDRFGVKAQIVLMHQGDETESPGGPNTCNLEAGVALNIAKTATPRVDAIFSGHSHQQYNCIVADPKGHPRPLIQGLSFGRLLSVVDLKIDRRTRDVIRTDTVAHNEIVTRDVTPDPTAQAIVTKARDKIDPVARRQVGSITADIVRAASASGESALGDVIADAQLDATASNGSVIAMTNPGGIRVDLNYASSPRGEGDGIVTYEDAFQVQPFANLMQTITLSGAQLKAVLEQQWQPQENGPTVTRFLQVSESLHYSWSQSAPIGSKISDITVAGTPVDPAATYRVSVNNFLASGGDGFTVFTEGTDLTNGPIDLDAFTAYLTAHPNLAPPALTRVTVLP